MENYLDQEFNRLGIDQTRVAAAAPAGDANAVFDLQAEIYTGDPPIISFSWTERALGDYNQDGLVSVNDLTPIGQRYNESVAHDDPAAHGGLGYWPTGDPDGAGADNWRAARIDGNDDGLIYLTDITTIAQHWNERLDGYRLYYQTPSMDDFALLPNPGDAGSPLTVPRSVADPGDPNQPYRYELNYSPPAEEGVYQFYVAPYDASADSEGTPSPILSLPEGEPPNAVIAAAPLFGNPPLAVDFNAVSSTDPDGEIIDYAWDFEGTGTFDYHTSEPFASHIYSDGGSYQARLRVEDDQHLADVAEIEITVNQAPIAVVSADPSEPTVVPLVAVFDASGSSDPDGEIVQYDWDMDDDDIFERVDAGPDAGMTYWMLIPDEKTAQVRVIDNDGLSDIAAVTVTGLYGDWEIVTLDNVGADAGEGCSLALVDGWPAVAYYHMGDQCLMLVRAANQLGTGFWHLPQILTPPGPPDEGAYPSLAVISGNPAIAYLDFGVSEVRFLRATNIAGGEWANAPVTVFAALGTDLSLCQVDGRPAMVYQTTGNDIFYHRALDVYGADWSGLPREIDGSPDDHFDPVLAVIGDTPGCTFMRDVGPKNILMYVHATDVAGADPWNDPVTVYAHIEDSAGYLGDLAMVEGNPAVTFNRCPDETDRGVPMFVRSASPEGASGTWSVDPPLEVSAEHSGSVRTSLAVINYVPHVVYYDFNLGSLWHVWGRNAAGTEWMEPVLIDDGDGHNVGAHCSLANINGRPGVAYQDDTAGALKYAVLH